MSQKTDPKAIIGTETEKVLLQSYFAESAAYSRYTFYAAQADKELFFPVGEVFRETAANELRHAKVFFIFFLLLMRLHLYLA